MDYLIGAVASVISISVIVIYLIVRMALRHEERKLELRAAASQGTSGAVLQNHEAEIQKLRDRVAVLERLLTDDDRRISDEISRLKHTEVRG